MGAHSSLQIWQRSNVFEIKCSLYAQRWPERYYLNQVKWQKRKYVPYCCPHIFFEKQFGFTMRRSVSKDHFTTIVHSQLCRHGLNIYSEDSWKDKSWPDIENSRKSISVRQLTMLNIGSISTNMKCQPPLAVFLAPHSQMRSNKLVELLQDFHLIVAYR